MTDHSPSHSSQADASPVDASSKSYAKGSELGKATQYPEHYTHDVLFPIPRADSRQALSLEPQGALPFHGVDRWMAWEMSWLNERGVPQVAVGRFEIDGSSPNIVESKSFKLYLNSFNQTRFSDWASVIHRLQRDLAQASGAPVLVRLMRLSEVEECGISRLQGESLDDLPIEMASDDYRYCPDVLTTMADDTEVSEALTSDLLRSNCPVTGQPDWGSVWISYQGRAIDRKGLLKYIIALRQQQDFHEQCVETLYMDIMRHCQPKRLSVYACYTRRGGLDINPFRSNCETLPEGILRLARQ